MSARHRYTSASIGLTIAVLAASVTPASASPPGAPTEMALAPCYQDCASPARTSSATPALTMTVTAPDGGARRYEYEIFDETRTTRRARSGSAVTNVPSGIPRTWTAPQLADGTYHWRGRGCAYTCGPHSEWFTFTVDSANPGAPTVTSDLYGPGWNGEPGVPGSFTFTPAAPSEGVVRWVYALNGGAAQQVAAGAAGVATVSIAPTRDMVNTLTVYALDAAGNRSEAVDYVFTVRSIIDNWHWRLDEGQGTSAPSESTQEGAPARPLTFTGEGVTWLKPGREGESAIALTGDGTLTTESPVLRRTAVSGATVAVAVRLPAAPPSTEDGDRGLPRTNQTAVSQDGTHGSLFRLGYRVDVDTDGDGAGDPAWCFTVKSADIADANETTACSTSYLAVDTWVHLTGVVNPTTGKISLYVNGSVQSDGVEAHVAGKVTWEADRALVLGSGRTATSTEGWVGAVDELHALPRPWNRAEIDNAATVWTPW